MVPASQYTPVPVHSVEGDYPRTGTERGHERLSLPRGVVQEVHLETFRLVKGSLRASQGGG